MKNTVLKRLVLDGNMIGNRGSKMLARSLELNTTLKSLALASNRFDDGAALHLARAVEHNASLTSLDAYNCPMTEVGVMEVKESLAKNTTITGLVLPSTEAWPNAQSLIWNDLSRNLHVLPSFFLLG